MGKNKFGKFIAFTTAVTAIGGVCYIYRDKIKESQIFQTVTGKIADWMDKDSEPDDFIFDDDFDDSSLFDEDAKNNREYTSITITSTTTEDEASEPTEVSISDNEPVTKDITSEDITQNEDVKNIISDNDTTETTSSITSFDDIVVNPSISSNVPEAPAQEPVAKESIDAFEYEGLSDVSEDPDVLEEQDKLDF